MRTVKEPIKKKNFLILLKTKDFLNPDCVNGTNTNGVTKTDLFGFLLDKPPGYKTINNPKVQHYNKKLSQN